MYRKKKKKKRASLRARELERAGNAQGMVVQQNSSLQPPSSSGLLENFPDVEAVGRTWAHPPRQSGEGLSPCSDTVLPSLHLKETFREAELILKCHYLN